MAGRAAISCAAVLILKLCSYAPFMQSLCIPVGSHRPLYLAPEAENSILIFNNGSDNLYLCSVGGNAALTGAGVYHL